MLKTITAKPIALRLALLIVTLFGVTFFLPQQQAGASPDAVSQAWIEPIHISTTSPSGAFAPVTKIAPDGTVMVMYNDERPDPSDPTKQLYTPYFSRRPGDKKTWTVGMAYDGSESAAQLDFTYDANSQAHVVWRTANGLYYAAESEWPVSNGQEIASSDGQRIDSPAIAVQGDTIIVVWLNDLQDVLYRYSRNGGQTWLPEEPLQPLNTNAASAPDVSFDANGDVHVVWEESTFNPSDFSIEYEVQHRKGTRTVTDYQWSAESNLSQGHENDVGESRQPSVIASDNVVHVVFEEREEVSGGGSDDANAQIYPYHASFVPGSGWQTPEPIIGDTPFFVNTRLPFYLGTALAACDGVLHVYFHGAEALNSSEMIWGTDNGNGSWRDPQAITSPNIRNTNPSVACSGTLLHLSFERIISSSTNHQIDYTANTGGGMFLPILFQ